MSAGSSAYSPLPQSNSDSDGSSEEELHVSRGNRIINRAAKVQNSTSEKGFNEQKNNVINYKPLGSNSDIGIALNKFQSNPDEVSVLKPDASLEIFSTSRKIWFVLSLFLCVFTTVAFIWLLPCNVDACPSASDLKNYNFTWEENLTNLEIYGPITFIPDGGGSPNLLFFTKSHLTSKKNYSGNGLLCLRGRDGSQRWQVNLDEEPTDVDCKIIDINADGVSDCLLQGRSFLRAVNPISGEEFWDIQKSNKNEEKIYFEDFPVILPDLNGDEVKEILLPCSFATSKLGINMHNYLVIISGKTGRILNNPSQIKSCFGIKNLTFENDTSLSFTCFISREVSFQKINLTELYKTLRNVSEAQINSHKKETLKQHVGYQTVARVNGYRLNLENRGDCPENCAVFVDIKDERERADSKTLLRFNRKYTFGMAPVAVKTKKEFGFLLKFWEWQSEAEKPRSQNNPQFSAQKEVILKNNTIYSLKRNKKLNLLNNSKILDDEMLSETEWESQRFKRTARRRTVRSDKGAFNLRVITESLVKINLNNSNVLITNVTKDEIIQVCKKPGICQPNFRNQRYSVLVADFGWDRGEKLITFSSKYVHNENHNKNSEDWFLQSRIRVLNL